MRCDIILSNWAIVLCCLAKRNCLYDSRHTWNYVAIRHRLPFSVASFRCSWRPVFWCSFSPSFFFVALTIPNPKRARAFRRCLCVWRSISFSLFFIFYFIFNNLSFFIFCFCFSIVRRIGTVERPSFYKEFHDTRKNKRTPYCVR
jgi:hypothetical protein